MYTNESNQKQDTNWSWFEGADNMEGAARSCLEAYDTMIEKLDALSSTVQSIHHAMEHEIVSPHILSTYITIHTAIEGISKEGFATRMELAGIIGKASKKHE